MLVFVERGKPESDQEKNVSEQRRAPTNSTHRWRRVWNRTRATLVGGECSHHCAIPTPTIMIKMGNVKIPFPNGLRVSAYVWPRRVREETVEISDYGMPYPPASVCADKGNAFRSILTAGFPKLRHFLWGVFSLFLTLFPVLLSYGRLWIIFSLPPSPAFPSQCGFTYYL